MERIAAPMLQLGCSFRVVLSLGESIRLSYHHVDESMNVACDEARLWASWISSVDAVTRRMTGRGYLCNLVHNSILHALGNIFHLGVFGLRTCINFPTIRSSKPLHITWETQSSLTLLGLTLLLFIY